MRPLDRLLRDLCAPLDPVGHDAAIRRLRRARRPADLDALAGAWPTDGPGKRLKLVKHGSGTFMVVEYDDGWTTRLSMAVLQR